MSPSFSCFSVFLFEFGLTRTRRNMLKSKIIKLSAFVARARDRLSALTPKVGIWSWTGSSLARPVLQRIYRLPPLFCPKHKPCLH